jgi:hypothetical protein
VRLIVEAELFLLDSEIGRLYLLSDLLYNSSGERKCAWLYRSEIQAVLPSVFVRLRGEYYRSATVALRARLIDRVHRVVAAWREWQVFDERYLKGLLFQFDDARLDFSQNYVSVTIPDPPDIVEREMRAYGLFHTGTSLDYGLLEQFRMHILGEDHNIDREPVSEVELENIDGESFDGEPYVPEEPRADSSSSMTLSSVKLSFNWKGPSEGGAKTEDVKNGKIEKLENIDDFFVQESRIPRRKHYAAHPLAVRKRSRR